jgi:adenylate cyclase
MSRLAGRWAPWLLALCLGLFGAHHALIAPSGLLQRLEWVSDDLRLRAALPAPAAPHPDIVIVDVDEASLERLGRWPWPRTRLARLSDELFERQRVAALGFDMVFAEPDDGHHGELLERLGADPSRRALLEQWRALTDGDAPLAAALRGRPAVLGWYLSADRGGSRAGVLPEPLLDLSPGTATPTLPRWDGHAANLLRLADAAPRQGFFNAQVDDDGVVRRVPAIARLDDAVYSSLALSLWSLAVGEPDTEVVWRDGIGGRVPVALRLRSAQGERQLPLDEQGTWRVPFRGAAGPHGGSFRYVSAADLIESRLPADTLAGQLVLLGSSAPGLADLRATPIHPAMPGVEVHAHLLAGLLDGQLVPRPDWAPAHEVALLLATLCLMTAIARRLPVPTALAAGGGVLGLVALLTQLLQHQAGWWLPQASVLCLGGLQLVLLMAARLLGEWQRRHDLQDLFSSYLPPERVRQLLREPGNPITAENRELTLLFCDLQGFSALAERLPPLALRDLLNRFFSDAGDIVLAQGGTLDKFIGDAVMAFWGAPLPQADHAARAVRAAMALADHLPQLNRHLQAQGLPPVGFGIGLATGLVCVGDLGSRRRRSYTAVGDAVNLAARLEALTRETGVGLLVADSTCEAARPLLPDCLWLEVDECRVRGRRQAVTVFTPLVPQAAQADAIRAQVHTWHLALTAARQQHGDLALEHLDGLRQLTSLHPDAVIPGLDRLVDRLRDRLSRSLP